MTSPYTLKELAELTHAKLVGDPSHRIYNINSLEEASVADASFLANPRYQEAMRKSQAGVICISPSFPQIPGKNYLIAEDPSLLFQKIAEILRPDLKNTTAFTGIHPTAVIHPTACIAEDVFIGPFVVIDQQVKIGKGTKIYPHVSIGPHSEIGENCLFYSGVSIRERCYIGNRVVLQSGAVIGSCGFGYTVNKEGKYIKLEQLGTVVLEDEVEIGANTTIDRARFKETRIAQGTKIDNLVQVAHNVEIGKNTMIAAQTGIAGSAKVGSSVLIGGQVGILGHIEISDGSMIATRSGISKSLPSPGKYRGSPAIPMVEYNKREVYIRKLEKLFHTLKTLEEKIEQLQKKASLHSLEELFATLQSLEEKVRQLQEKLS